MPVGVDLLRGRADRDRARGWPAGSRASGAIGRRWRTTRLRPDRGSESARASRPSSQRASSVAGSPGKSRICARAPPRRTHADEPGRPKAKARPRQAAQHAGLGAKRAGAGLSATWESTASASVKLAGLKQETAAPQPIGGRRVGLAERRPLDPRPAPSRRRPSPGLPPFHKRPPMPPRLPADALHPARSALCASSRSACLDSGDVPPRSSLIQRNRSDSTANRSGRRGRARQLSQANPDHPERLHRPFELRRLDRR